MLIVTLTQALALKERSGLSALTRFLKQFSDVTDVFRELFISLANSLAMRMFYIATVIKK